MFFVHQHADDDDQNPKYIFLTDIITSFKDIKIDENTHYILIDLDGTIIDRMDIKIHGIEDYEFYKESINSYRQKHKKNCRFVKNTQAYFTKNCGFTKNTQMYFNKYFTLFYITEHDINNTIQFFKQNTPKLQGIYSLSRSWPGEKIDGIYSRESQLLALGINCIEKYIWTNHIDKGVFLCGWNGSLKEYCECCYDLNNIEIKNQPGYFDAHPEMIGKNIVIIDNDIDQLNYIYNSYKQKYPEHLSKLKLYLYNNKFVLKVESGELKNLIWTINVIEQEYCDCKSNQNTQENENKYADSANKIKGGQNVT
jgi:hypothetical protein